MEVENVLVNFSLGEVTVDRQIVTIGPGKTVQIRWNPPTDVDWVLKMVVFTRPIGNGTPITIPAAGPGGSIVVTDVNDNTSGIKDRFKYMIFVERNGRIFPSADPEIVNDPEGGVMDDEEDGGG